MASYVETQHIIPDAYHSQTKLILVIVSVIFGVWGGIQSGELIELSTPVSMVGVFLLLYLCYRIVLFVDIEINVDHEQITASTGLFSTRDIPLEDVSNVYVMDEGPSFGHGIYVRAPGVMIIYSYGKPVKVETKNGSDLIYHSRNPNELIEAVKSNRRTTL